MTPEKRPELNLEISAETFTSWYWLKAELSDFCRQNKLSTSGSKIEITERIRVFLESGTIVSPTRPKAKRGKMPTEFSRDTVVGTGWSSSQALRAFFEQEIGSNFHFDGVMRDFVKKDGVGKTLQDGIDLWHESRNRPKSDIAPQFEYNRHFRAYFEANPNATREEAIAAWHAKRGKAAD